MGTFDKSIRLLIAIILVVLYFTNVISGTLGIIALIIAGVFILTSLLSFCPLYTVLGFNTCEKK
ncbi:MULTISPECIES: YgaP family membrane protein [Empedobacter]